MHSIIASKLGLDKKIIWTAGIFFLICMALQVWRMQSLSASMDQGILFQILWNGLHGQPFESTLSSQLSADVVIEGNIPTVGYHRLGQHFTPILIIWIPFIALLGKWFLPFLQVSLITSAGLILYSLSKTHLQSKLSYWITLSFFGANAVIGPCLGNFTDLSQLPLLVFLLILGLEKKIRWLIMLSAISIPLVREDTGVVLLAIGIWIIVRNRSQWKLGGLLTLYGGLWVIIATNLLMPMFSEDTSRRFMVENFGQYLQGRDKANSIQVLKLALQQPLVIFKELVSPPGKTIGYLMGQGLPLMFVPFLSIDSWLMMGLPLLGLLMAQGNPLAINWRYTYLVVPGLFAGSIYWWKNNARLFSSQKIRNIWTGCIILSIIFTITSNPNRTLSWLIPESIEPWVFHSPINQIRHSRIALNAIKKIPRGDSVSASSTLVPHLAARRVLIRFPYHTSYRDSNKEVKNVEWLAIDLEHHRKYANKFRNEWKDLQEILQKIKHIESKYSPNFVEDGVILMKLNGAEEPKIEKKFRALLEKTEKIKTN